MGSTRRIYLGAAAAEHYGRTNHTHRIAPTKLNEVWIVDLRAGGIRKQRESKPACHTRRIQQIYFSRRCGRKRRCSAGKTAISAYFQEKYGLPHYIRNDNGPMRKRALFLGVNEIAGMADDPWDFS